LNRAFLFVANQELNEIKTIVSETRKQWLVSKIFISCNNHVFGCIQPCFGKRSRPDTNTLINVPQILHTWLYTCRKDQGARIDITPVVHLLSAWCLDHAWP
jgi:hypothetical protein